MTTENPTSDQVISGVISVIAAMSPLPGVALDFENHKDDEVEFIDGYKVAGEDLHLFLVHCPTVDEEEGPATGEAYPIYNIQIRYLSVMVSDRTWSRDALHRAKLVMRALSGHASVFAIGGQRQLRTQETVSMGKHDFVDIGGQRMYEILLTLRVEARRWS